MRYCRGRKWTNPWAMRGQPHKLPPSNPRNPLLCLVPHSPCLGAQRIDVEPTRGVSKLSGKERIGHDVQREQFKEQLSDALKPLSGMDRRQYAAFERRFKLNPDTQQECRRLDTHIPPLERQELQVSGSELAAVQQRLFALRKRYRELGC